LRQSVRLWLEIGCPLQAAAARLALARALAADGDPAGADLEIGTAEETYRSLDLAARLGACDELRRELESPARPS
ncbi:MAG: hypothetical protein R3190_12175, partial [Thermoanaerobaculia bacterium]|nr:hypothetical protein [Thermoanaerobaculia bacterium]